MSGDTTMVSTRHLQLEDVDSVFRLHREVVCGLDDPSLFRENDRDFFVRHISAEGISIGVFRQDTLIAYALLRFPGFSEDNLGRDLGLPAAELSSVVHLEMCATAAAARGNRFQSELTRRRLLIAKSLGYKHACVTIAPRNVPSIRSHLANGLIVKKVKAKYGGFERFILYQNLSVNESSLHGAVRDISLENLDEIRRALECGYVGIGLTTVGGRLYLTVAEWKMMHSIGASVNSSLPEYAASD